jgi:hypothetical protein
MANADNIASQSTDNKEHNKSPLKDVVKIPQNRVSNGKDEKGRFLPGYCANPGGRPKHDLLSEIADQVFKKNPEQMKDKLHEHIINKGDARLIQVLGDRAYGRLQENVNITGTVDLAVHLQQSRTMLELPEAHLDDEIVEGEIVEADHGLADPSE